MAWLSRSINTVQSWIKFKFWYFDKFALFVWWQVEKQLLSEHLTTMLQKGLDSLMEENRVDELALLYGLLNRVKKGLLELCANFNSYIKVLIMTDYYSLVFVRLQFCTSRHIYGWKYGQWLHTNKFGGYPVANIFYDKKVNIVIP